MRRAFCLLALAATLAVAPAYGQDARGVWTHTFDKEDSTPTVYLVIRADSYDLWYVPLGADWCGKMSSPVEWSEDGRVMTHTKGETGTSWHFDVQGAEADIRFPATDTTITYERTTETPRRMCLSRQNV